MRPRRGQEPALIAPSAPVAKQASSSRCACLPHFTRAESVYLPGAYLHKHLLALRETVWLGATNGMFGFIQPRSC